VSILIPPEMRSGTVAVTGGELAYHDAGQGPAVLLLHAAIGDSRGWDLLAPRLARHHRVISFDARGFGRSSRPDKPFSLVEDVRELMDGLGLADAALVGNSMGAATAVDFALAYPERVAGLVLVAPGLTGFPREDPPVEDEILAAVEAGRLEQAAELDRRYWAPLDSGPEVEELIDRMTRENAHVFELSDDLLIEPPEAAGRLHELSADILVVLGAADVEDVQRIGAFIAAQAPAARVVSLDDADHLVPLRAPDALCELIETHLSRRA
jgi:3-oxoadipate enol-lactonase